jgi:phytol kinase
MQCNAMITTQDWIGLGVSYTYATTLLVLAEVIRRWRGYPQDFTRKIVHVGAGMWVFGVLGIFDNWYIGVIPFISFIFLNYIFYRYRLFEAVDAEDSSPGTIYFALSISILFLLLWRTDSPNDLGYIAAAGAMAMTWGDAMAAIIGKRFGRHRHSFGGGKRTWEGTAAMFIASALAMSLTLLLVPGSSLSPLTQPLSPLVAISAALLAATLATVAEAVSPSGFDNLNVPLLAGAVLFAVVTLVG